MSSNNNLKVYKKNKEQDTLIRADTFHKTEHYVKFECLVRNILEIKGTEKN